MAEARRQYDQQMAVAQPVVDAQLQVMQQGLQQGQDYYDYMTSRQRPVEDALQQNALKDTSAADAAERAAITGAQGDYANTIGSIGSQQQASGQAYADGLRQLLSQYGAGSSALLGKANGVADSIRGNSAKYEGQINDDIKLFTSGNDAIRAKYGTDIENDANLALADARAGQAQATNSAIRQAMRYGLNVDSIAGGNALAQAQAQAAAANGTRTASTDKYRAVVGQGIGMRQNLMNSSNQAAIAAGQADLSAAGMGLDNLGNLTNFSATALGADKAARDDGFASQLASAQVKAGIPGMSRDLRINDESRANAKLLDAAGLYRGLSGASSGAYGLAVGAGNSANANNSAAGNALMSNIGAANSLQMGGRQLAMNGLSNILGSQTSIYNQSQAAGSSLTSTLGSLAGVGANLYFGGSERSYKTDIVKLRDDPRGFAWYEFSYLPEFAAKWGEGRRVGVMADELREVIPEAVIRDEDGLTLVNYSMLN